MPPGRRDPAPGRGWPRCSSGDEWEQVILPRDEICRELKLIGLSWNRSRREKVVTIADGQVGAACERVGSFR